MFFSKFVFRSTAGKKKLMYTRNFCKKKNLHSLSVCCLYYLEYLRYFDIHNSIVNFFNIFNLFLGFT